MRSGKGVKFPLQFSLGFRNCFDMKLDKQHIICIYANTLSYNYSVWNTTDVQESMEEFRERCEAETTFNLEIGSSLQWQEGDVEVSMEKEYE